jgi:hypothetical protein
MKEQPKIWLRKRRVAERYDITERSIDRWTRTGRLPKPKYNNSPIPLWSSEELDAHDAAMLTKNPRKYAQQLMRDES